LQSNKRFQPRRWTPRENYVAKRRIRDVADIDKVLAKIPAKVAKMQREVAELEAKIQKLREEKLPWLKAKGPRG